MSDAQASGDPDERDTDVLDDALLVPPEAERAWVLDGLGTLVRRRGHEHLTLAPLVEANEQFFPDRWRGGEPSLRRLIRRLLVYADLDDARVEVVVHEDVDVGPTVAPAGVGGPMWFVRKQDGTLHFAARASVLRDPRRVVSATARAVTEAYRVWHGLAVPDLLSEHKLVDLTSVYLCFGILATDARLRHGTTATATLRLQRTKTELGVLPAQTLAFALAVVLDVRGVDRKGLRRLTKDMQANPAEFVRASLARLRASESPMAETLGIPPREDWPPPPDLDVLTAPFEDTGDAEDVEETRRDQDRGSVGINEGRPVFRVERSMALRLAKMLALPVVLLGMLASRMNLGIEIEMWKAGALAAGLGLAGLGIGRLMADVRCSEPKCGTALRPDDKTCPHCGGTVVGAIRHPKERLAAEEAWRQKHPP
jgi:hypothetical protein